MISTFDLKLIHETFIDLKWQYSDKSVRFQYFLATCLYLDADIIWILFWKTDHMVV